MPISEISCRCNIQIFWLYQKGVFWLPTANTFCSPTANIINNLHTELKSVWRILTIGLCRSVMNLYQVSSRQCQQGRLQVSTWLKFSRTSLINKVSISILIFLRIYFCNFNKTWRRNISEQFWTWYKLLFRFYYKQSSST